MFIPISFHPDKSLPVYEESKAFLEKSGYEERISKTFWAYHCIGDLIPQSKESLWSGHIFPWLESYQDLQISYNLCLFGFYKQAMGVLRSGLELGLLSVYWNLNDEGHNTIKNWLHSKQETPRNNEILGRLSHHPSFKEFLNHHDLKKRMEDLGQLHDYVHTKGKRFSNSPSILNSNCQTFNETAFDNWYLKFVEVIKVLSICHLIKYPLGTVRFSWDDKFGIDKPLFGGLDENQVDILEELIEDDIFSTVSILAKKDQQVIKVMEWIQNLPDLTPDELDQQLLNMDKQWIEMSGLECWLISQETAFPHVKDKERWQRNVDLLTKWAKEEGFDMDPLERLNKD